MVRRWSYYQELRERLGIYEDEFNMKKRELRELELELKGKMIGDLLDEEPPFELLTDEDVEI